ncbi:MAG: hypothetical protein DCC56_06515 [Anaerolineae bacterium]|nr:MAG: hypothetical protein DCC56_06515 [Anaerolineae bacterium]WKZ43494.1 MAG: DUF86 domain-containing protein [Anaerolineales bacterium]HNS45580.1 DUF86 domain-containing protein [Alphaproteobacteria bacterium]
MSRDDAYVYDMLESAQAILGYMAGKTWEEFSKDALLQDAVVRRLEIIGEAAGRVSAETQKKYSYIPWMAMRGTRNRVIHGYDNVQLDIIWDIVQDDLPGLINELQKIIPAS